MKRLLFLALPLSLMAQESRSVPPGFKVPDVPPPPSSREVDQASRQQARNIIYQPAAPVEVNGKRADQMTDDELREFLDEKIQTFHQSQDSVELIRVAPGYGVTMVFDVPPVAGILGDTTMFTFKNEGRLVTLSANRRQGDTTMKVILPGFKVLNYHLFIEKNFIKADSTIRVAAQDGGSSSAASTGRVRPPLDVIARIVGNYDALIREKSLGVRDVRRIEVMKKSALWPFTYYDFYRFSDGTVVLTFLYGKPRRDSGDPPRLDEKRIRLMMGNSLFLPDVTCLSDALSESGQGTGFLVFYEPPFAINQPFDIVLK